MPRRRSTLYLASQSSRRQELLKELKILFKVTPSAYRERWCRKTAPEVLCVRHAIGKAKKAVLPQAARFVLGGDTIVWHHGRGLGKPRTRAEALRMLCGLAGKKHAVYTGLAIWDRKTGSVLTGCARTDVWLKPVGEAWLEKYVDTIHPFDKAGAYAIQARLKIVRKIRGSYSNVVGLPKELLRKMLNEIEQKTDVFNTRKSIASRADK
ncbi:MAG: Maf family protein [Candidatus Omnitrophica bacterium]|nr:Maf family protein [Candidatus Omnitrophota bacterium]